MSQIKHNAIKSAVTGLVISTFLGVLFGLFLLLVNVNFLLNIIFVVLGILTVINNLPTLIVSIAAFRTSEGKLMLVLSLVATVLGILMIFFHNSLFMILMGAYFVLVPLVRLIFSKERSELLREEAPKLIIGVVMILLGPAYTVSVLFRIAGWGVIGLTVVYLIGAILSIRRAQHKTGTRTFVDHDGDGTVDAIYIDTTGDGKVDTSTRFHDPK